MKLLTAGTPNGWKVSIMLEELVEAGLIEDGFETQIVDLFAGEQFGEEFTSHNLNQKIPVLLDCDIAIVESCAILQYLAEKYSSPLLPRGESRWQVLQWLYWQAANVGPVFGNKLAYTRYLTELPDEMRAHPLERFGNEARRLTAVLELQLGSGPYVSGEHYSIADIALYPWLRGWKWSKVDISDRPNILAWLKTIRSRPAVERGLAYGTDKHEIDQWSEERKVRYAQGGALLARKAQESAD